MAGELQRLFTGAPEPQGPYIRRSTERVVQRIGERGLVRLADVQAEGTVQMAKLREIDHLARTAMSGQAMLRKWADTLAAGDPTFAAELLFFTDLARLSKAEVIADTVDTYCRESRR